MSDDPRLDAFFRKAGADIESALREAGSALPENVDPEELVRGLFEEMQREASSERGRARGRRMVELARALQREFPRTFEDPEYMARLNVGMKQIIDEIGPDPAASA